MQLWHLDDGVIAGKLSDLELFFNELSTEFPASLNKLKCNLFTKGECTQQLSLSSLPREDIGFEIPAAPVGYAEFVAAAATYSKVVKAVELCECVAAIVNDPQIAVALLSVCTGACRVTHLMKTVPPLLIARALSLLSASLGFFGFFPALYGMAPCSSLSKAQRGVSFFTVSFFIRTVSDA